MNEKSLPQPPIEEISGTPLFHRYDIRGLLENEERYRAVITGLTEGVLFFDKQGVIQTWNTSAEHLLGLSTGQLRGEIPFDPYWRAIREDGSPFPRTAYPARVTLKTGKPCFGVVMGIEKPGTELIWLSINSRAVFHNQEQTPAAVVVSMSDITNHKRAEQALRDDEHSARATLDALSASIVTLDETGLIITVNQAWRDFAKANAPGVEGLSEGANYLTVCDRSAATGDTVAGEFAAGVRAVVRGERASFSLEYDCHSAGEQRWFTGRVTRFNYSGTLRIVVAHENITARKQAEERLKERERLAAIGVTAATFAHQVGNPLNSISTTLQLLERRLANLTGPPDEKILAPVRNIATEVARLTTLLEEFRFLTRREVLELKSLDITTLIEDFLAKEGPSYADRGTEVQLELPPDLPRIYADAEKLTHVLNSLCTNAVEAMPQGGTLTLRAYWANDQVSLEIRDTGIGVPRGMDILEPFVTSKAQGTGLGLTMARQIVSLHGGSLTYQSVSGQGTTFTVMLPMTQK